LAEIPKFVAYCLHMFKFGGWELYKTGDLESPFSIVMRKRNSTKIYLIDEFGLIQKKVKSLPIGCSLVDLG
jgi:hypothetical protein